MLFGIAKEQRKQKIFDLWMAGETNKDVAEFVGITEEAVRQSTQEMADLPKLGKVEQNAANHETDFDVPIYNIWKQQSKSEGSTHFGNSDLREEKEPEK